MVEISQKKNLKQFLLEDVLGHEDPPLKKSLSIGLGIFIGLSPFWGFQTALVFGIAILCKLNKMLAFAFSNISLPPMIPLIVWAGLHMGSWLTGQRVTLPRDWSNWSEWKATALQHLWLYGIGSLTLAAICAALSILLSYAWLRKKSKFNLPPPLT